MKNRFLLILILLAAFTAGAQDRYTPLPIDPKIRYGVLDNGLTYYIRHNPNPPQRAEFYIVQNVGSILEEENQRGLAHFLEHMAFNGTRSFPGNSMLEYLESIGVKFGTNLNAYTSFDETVYNISGVPVIREGIIDSVLLVLHDWSSAISLNDSDIDNERKVIHEEWRTRQNSMMRMLDQVLPTMYPDNRYAHRLPIGLMEVVDNFPYQTLRDYYHRWYRPDLQAIIVVGDIDPDSIEAKIRSMFGSIKMPENPAKRVWFDVADNHETIVAIGSDKEATEAELTIFYKHDVLPDSVKKSAAGLYIDYLDAIVSSMFNARLNELAKKPNPPFTFARAYNSDYFISKTKRAFVTEATGSQENIKRSMEALVLETRRVYLHGFTASEYQRTMADYLTAFENLYAEREKIRNQNYVYEYVQHFTEGGSIAGIEVEYSLLKNYILPSVTVEEINSYVRSLIKDYNIVITLMSPEKEGVQIPTQQELLALFNDVRSRDAEPYADSFLSVPLVPVLPAPGKVVRWAPGNLSGSTVWTLSNGARVIVKPTTLKEDEIIFSASAPGGNSLIADSEARNIKIMNQVVPVGGLGDFSATDLPKALAGKKAGIRSSVGTLSENLSGRSSVKDAETLFQLIYLSFTAPREDDEAFGSWKERYRTYLENAQADPGTTLSDSVASTLYRNNPRTTRFKTEDLDKINYGRILELYRERFANAGNFVFTFVGNVDTVLIKSLAAQYIAPLPATSARETFRDLNINPPQGEVINRFDKRMETPKTNVNIWYSGVCAYNPENIVKMDFVNQILTSVFVETLREGEGGTYGAGVAGNIDPAKNRYTLFVRFDTNAAQRDALIAIVHREMARLAAEGPSEKDFNKVREYMLKKHKEDMTENSYWASVMDTYHLFGVDMYNGYAETVEKQNIATIRDFAKELLSQGNVAEVVMNGVAE